MAFDTETLKKQANNVSTEYMRLLKEKGTSSDAKEDTSSSLKKENSELKDKLDEMTKELKKSKQQVEAVKKQAENQQTAYLELMDKNKSLQNRLDDFNVVFGGAQKKNV